jgi:hypothetical protein
MDLLVLFQEAIPEIENPERLHVANNSRALVTLRRPTCDEWKQISFFPANACGYVTHEIRSCFPLARVSGSASRLPLFCRAVTMVARFPNTRRAANPPERYSSF